MISERDSVYHNKLSTQLLSHSACGSTDLRTCDVGRFILYSREAYTCDEVKEFMSARVIFNHDTFSTWKMKPSASEETSCSRVTFLQMFNDIGALSMRLRCKDGHKCMGSLYSMGSNFIARIPHISRMWDAIIVELFEQIMRTLDQQGEMAMTSVAALEVLADPQDDRQEEAIEELVEFDVIMPASMITPP